MVFPLSSFASRGVCRRATLAMARCSGEVVHSCLNLLVSTRDLACRRMVESAFSRPIRAVCQVNSPALASLGGVE